MAILKASGLLKKLGIVTKYNAGIEYVTIKRACEANLQASVHIEGRLANFGSFFVQMDESKDYFYIDTLLPGVDESNLIAGKTVMQLAFEMNSVGQKFYTTYMGTQKLEGFDSLKFSMPESIESVQKRQYFRVKPRLSDPVQVYYKHKDKRFSSQALDISVGGMRFNINHAVDPARDFLSVLQLPANNKLIKVRLSSRGLEKIAHPGKLKDNKVDPYILRAEFGGMGLVETQAVDKYIMDRQREIIRLT